MIERYRRQVQLLMSVLPDVAKEETFALKGGTAINMFHRALPRLSVDIDLTYLPLSPREQALIDIDEALNRIVTNTSKRMANLQAKRIAGGGNHDTRILLSDGNTRIKIETSPVARGVVKEPSIQSVSEPVANMFGFAQMKVVSFEDLYAGKLHAALDR